MLIHFAMFTLEKAATHVVYRMDAFSILLQLSNFHFYRRNILKFYSSSLVNETYVKTLIKIFQNKK